MPAKIPMIALAKRKQLLILEADLHRALLRTECDKVHARLNWLGEARQKARSAGPWLAAGAVVVGILAARRGPNLTGWIATELSIWRAIQDSKSR